MSARSFGIAILVHATLVGVALNQLERPETNEPAVATQVAVERQFEAPTAGSSPHRLADLPDVEFSESEITPALDEILLPEVTLAPQPQPPGRERIFEPTPEPQRPSASSNAPLRRRAEPSVVPAQPASPAEATSDASTSRGTPGKTQIRACARPDVPPRLLIPIWPERVREEFVGTFIVKLIIGTNGRALQIEVEQGTGNERLDSEMTRTFESALFTPGLVNGTPVVSDHRIRIHFRRAR